MTGILRTGALTSTTQMVSVALNEPPFSATLNSVAAGRLIRFSNSRSGDVGTFYTPDVDATSTGAISVAGLAPVKWIEFTGTIGDTYEVQ